ncbi:MAG: RNA polymerase sigma factor [Patescibacteria group bacterium]
MDTDEDVITQYLEGDPQALKILIDRYTPILYNFTARFTGTFHAADVVQDVFIKAWKSIGKFNASKARFKTWIFAIARNTIIDHLRKKRSLVFSDIQNDDTDSFDESIADESPLPDEMLEKLEDKTFLNGMIAKLPADYQTVLLMYYGEDMTFAEIGEVLSKPLNTVKSHHRRAVQKLRAMMS